jgi:hypothetical protein
VSTPWDELGRIHAELPVAHTRLFMLGMVVGLACGAALGLLACLWASS